MDKALLRREASRLGIELTEEQLSRFQRYEALLQHWGSRINLTAIRDSEQIVRGHFLDSLAVVAALGVADPGQCMVDVGSGAGFPGLVCALLWPLSRITTVERVQKKSAFLMSARRELDVQLEVVAGDVRMLNRQFAVVMSRAAFPPTEWAAVGGDLVAPGGQLIFMLSERQPVPDRRADFRSEHQVTYELGQGSRRVVVWRRS